REVTKLLVCDALLRAQDNDPDGALASCRAAVNAGRSVGDEPAGISQLMRMVCLASACQHVEPVLAQGQPGEPGLAALQGLLEDEARQPLLLITARGERAILHQVLEAIEAGEFTFAELADKNAPCSATDWVANYFARDTIKPGHAEVLRFMTEYVA